MYNQILNYLNNMYQINSNQINSKSQFYFKIIAFIIVIILFVCIVKNIYSVIIIILLITILFFQIIQIKKIDISKLTNNITNNIKNKFLINKII